MRGAAFMGGDIEGDEGQTMNNFEETFRDPFK
jgi:hypothetical protein